MLPDVKKHQVEHRGPEDSANALYLQYENPGVLAEKTFLTRTPSLLRLTEDVRGVDLQDEPAVSLVGVGAEDGEDGALLAGLGQQLVHVHLPLGELKVGPDLALVGAVPEHDETRRPSCYSIVRLQHCF